MLFVASWCNLLFTISQSPVQEVGHLPLLEAAPPLHRVRVGARRRLELEGDPVALRHDALPPSDPLL